MYNAQSTMTFISGRRLQERCDMGSFFSFSFFFFFCSLFFFFFFYGRSIGQRGSAFSVIGLTVPRLCQPGGNCSGQSSFTSWGRREGGCRGGGHISTVSHWSGWCGSSVGGGIIQLFQPALASACVYIHMTYWV